MPNNPPSRAEQFFQNLISRRSSAFKRLSDLVSQKAEENEWRDFKEAKFIHDPLPPEASDKGKTRRDAEKRRNDTVKRLWSENLSAFANTGGGVLIWGIDAPQRVAESLSLAGDAQALADRLIELQNDAVDPPVQGVEVCAVTKGKSKEGFVVCYIPESAFSPHRSLLIERDYYMRAGDSNRSIPTALLRRMFYPQLTPLLVPTVAVKLVKTEPNGEAGSFLHERDGLLHLVIEVAVINRGNASAQDACISIMIRGDLNCALQENLQNGLWEIVRHHNYEWRSCKKTIHPDQTVPLFDSLTNRTGFGPPDDEKVFKLEFKIFAHNTPALVSEVTFTGTELKKSLEDKECIRRDALPSSRPW